MTNEQTAILLSGYLVELSAAIEATECLIQPTMIKNSGVAISLGGREELETYPQLSEITDLTERLRDDIATLKGES